MVVHGGYEGRTTSRREAEILPHGHLVTDLHARGGGAAPAPDRGLDRHGDARLGRVQHIRLHRPWGSLRPGGGQLGADERRGAPCRRRGTPTRLSGPGARCWSWAGLNEYYTPDSWRYVPATDRLDPCRFRRLENRYAGTSPSGPAARRSCGAATIRRGRSRDRARTSTPTASTWTPTSQGPDLPAARGDLAGVCGTRLVLWGGWDGSAGALASGGALRSEDRRVGADVFDGCPVATRGPRCGLDGDGDGRLGRHSRRNGGPFDRRPLPSLDGQLEGRHQRDGRPGRALVSTRRL